MYPRAFILPQRARRMAGWLAGLRKFARRTAGKGCGCNFFFFPLQTTLIGQWRAEKGRIRLVHTKRLKLAGAAI